MGVEFNESFNKFVQWANGDNVIDDSKIPQSVRKAMHIDLSKLMPVVSDVKFTQTFTPYEIKTNPDVGPVPEEYLS